MTRGFITIATGDKHYREIAANLLLSYHLNTKNPMPFAIITEEEDEYTSQFDNVIITQEANRSFIDKFLLLKLCPYDETIFFDADILAFGDLNEYWEVFTEKSTDFSSIGVNVGGHEEGTWYIVEDIWEYGEKISYKVRVHMGVCFVRRSDKLEKMYRDCMDILKNYDRLYFHTCSDSYDEATMGIAMPLNDMRAEDEVARMMAYLPCLTSVYANMLKRSLSYKTEWGSSVYKNGLLIHFATRNTTRAFYKFEVKCLQYIQNGKRNPISDFVYQMTAAYYGFSFSVN